MKAVVYAELRAVPESFCWPIPPGLSTDEAACVPVAFGTAHDALLEFGRLQAGEKALIQAGAGGSASPPSSSPSVPEPGSSPPPPAMGNWPASRNSGSITA